MPRRPSNTELSQAVSDILTACERFRELLGRATPRQREAVMAGFPWHKSVLGLHEMRAWAGVTGAELAKLKEERPARDSPDKSGHLRAAG